MWKNWVYKPFICLSSGFLAQSIVSYIYEIKYYLTPGKIDRNYVDYRKAEIKLFLLNFYQNNLSCKILSILAFLIRYPLRISFFKFILNRIYILIRN